MKYGESAFDILYLLFAFCSAIVLLKNAKNRTGQLMGTAALVLGAGDSFHLVPRVLNYFVQGDFTVALGLGKLVTSVTMTVFYVILYYVWLGCFPVENSRKTENRTTETFILLFAAVRIVLCMPAQNGWLQNGGNLTWALIRNVPFVVLGAAVCRLWFLKRKDNGNLSAVWLFILLSFAFYLPVAVGAAVLPLLGMLMLPKTVCYILMLTAFLKEAGK